ncbi:MAG: YciI family protein [Vicinamibacteria bacterium]
MLSSGGRVRESTRSPPDAKLFEEMGKFNQELEKAGILLAAEGLQPSSKGARVRFSGSKRAVIDGPFTEARELIAGFWLWQVKSKEEAIEWVKRCPNPMLGDSEIEIRQVYETEDFADLGLELTPERRARMEQIRARTAKRS